MIVLGILGLGKSPGAAIFEDGRLIACVEEERFTREKVARGRQPVQSIKYCLKEAGITLSEVDKVALAWDCSKYPLYMRDFFAAQERDYPRKGRVFRENEEAILRRYTRENYIDDLNAALMSLGIGTIDKIYCYDHHKSHAAASFYHSGLTSALVFIMDGSGEDRATTVWLAKDGELIELREFKLPNSLGRAYSSITEYLGFKAYTDEGKVMGLAPYGSLDTEIHEKMKRLIEIRPDGDYAVDPNLIYYGRHTYNARFTDELVGLLGPPRKALKRNDPIYPRYKDIAYSIQALLEEAVTGLVRRYIKDTGVKNVCIGGGVAMNCKMNGVISSMKEVEGLFVHPASHDGGACIGAAMLCLKESIPNIRFEPLTHAYYGPSYDTSEIEDFLRYSKLRYTKPQRPAEIIAQALSEGKICAVFNGRMEMGARALGNRSILASPLLSDTKKVLNDMVKHREDWRPFCPSILSEYGPDYFEPILHPGYMVVAVRAKEEKSTIIPSAVHCDGTARPQYVRRETSPLFWEIIEKFRKITGVPIIINTSFNIMGEPIINTPQEAVRCFYSTGIDMLLIEGFILCK